MAKLTEAQQVQKNCDKQLASLVKLAQKTEDGLKKKLSSLLSNVTAIQAQYQTIADTLTSTNLDAKKLKAIAAANAKIGKLITKVLPA